MGAREINALDKLKRGVGEQKLAQHNGTRDTDALPCKVELLDAVVTQGAERNVAEVNQRRVLKHRPSETLSAFTRDVIPAHTAQGTKQTQVQQGSKQKASTVSGC